jgi:cobaltochelatase CobS
MLKCKICGLENPDELVTHIETEHGRDLAGYFTEFGCSVADVVAEEAPPESVAKAVTAPAKPKKVKAKGDSVETATPKVEPKPTEKKSSAKNIINGVELPLGRGGEFVPSINEAYHFSENAADVAKDAIEGRKIMLIGHTGTGKTSLVEQLAAHSNQGTLRSNLNGQTTIGEFVGLWTVKGGETVWVDGVLPKAMKEGLWLILDEIDFAEPAILSVLNAVLEKNGKLMLKEKGHEIVTPHKDFRIFATANGVGCMSDFRGLYQGTNIMNEAFLDRWRCYHVDYLPAEEEAKVLAATVDKMTIGLASQLVKVGNMIREAFKKEEVSCTMSLRRLIDWSELMVRYRDPIKAANPAIFSKVSKEDKEVIEGVIKRVLLGQTR